MKNSFKEALQTGEPQFGIWNGIPDTYVAEICAGAGFDWITIDGEHGPFDLRTIILQMQAMAAYDVSPIVRVPGHDPVWIKQVLDTGAQNLIVPMVETVEQAQGLVKAMRYAPKGIRGVGGGLARAARWDGIPHYYERADEEICLIAQIESVTGMANLEAIVQTEGVDVILLGAADLAATMGLLGQPNHPEVMKMVEKAIQVARKYSKGAGILTTDPDIARHYMQFGANMVGVGLDTILLANAARSLAESFKY